MRLTGRALVLEPSDAETRSNRAAAYEALGRLSAAADDWALVARESPGTPLGRAAARRAQRLSRAAP